MWRLRALVHAHNSGTLSTISPNAHCQSCAYSFHQLSKCTICAARMGTVVKEQRDVSHQNRMINVCYPCVENLQRYVCVHRRDVILIAFLRTDCEYYSRCKNLTSSSKTITSSDSYHWFFVKVSRVRCQCSGRLSAFH